MGPTVDDRRRSPPCNGADGIVFVVDSQECPIAAWVRLLEGLDAVVARRGSGLSAVAMVLQDHKRDVPTALPRSELDRLLNASSAAASGAASGAPAVGCRATPRGWLRRMLDRL